jgi:HEAT repeat protein
VGRLPDRRGAELLVEALVNGDYVRSRIASSLEAFPLDIPDLIAPLLDSENATVRYWGAMLTRRYATASVGGALRRATEDHDPLVRRAAVETLAALPGLETERAVRARLTDPVPFVRAHAARALAALGDRGAIIEITRLLADADWWVRSSAKQALEAFGRSAVEPLLQCLIDADGFARNGAAELLQNLGVFEELVALEATGPSNPERLRLCRLLAQAGGVRMCDGVVSRLDPVARDRARQLMASIDLHSAGVQEIA